MIKPHRIIGDNYLHRWHCIPRNKFFNIYLHKFMASDDDRALHCHPWHSVSILLRGSLHEVYRLPGDRHIKTWRRIRRFVPVFRRAQHAHRMVLPTDPESRPAWTLFITGPKIREWGYHCPKGWQHHLTISTQDGRIVGGCE